MYREVPSITDKAAWVLKHTQHLDDANFKTGAPDADQAFLRDLVAFYVVFEGMWLYTGFAQILSLGWRGMARAYSNDLRERVAASVALGRTCRETAELFGVSVSSVVKWSQRRRSAGTAAALPMAAIEADRLRRTGIGYSSASPFPA